MKTKVALIYALALTLLSAAIVAAAPGAPAHIRASKGRYADRITVNWDAVPNAQVYRVYRSSEDHPDLRVILGAWQAETRFADRTAESGVRYFYWIKTSDGNQTSGFGEAGSGYLKVDKLAGASVRVRDLDDVRGLRLVWNEVLGAGFYRVYRGVRADTASALPISDWITAGEFRDLQASPGVDFYYWVKSAFDPRGNGTSGFSALVGGRRALASPAGLATLSGRAEAVLVKWNGAVGARYYQVYRSARPDTATALPISDWIGAAEFSDQIAVPGTRYYYWVKAATSPSSQWASTFSSRTSGFSRLSRPTSVEVVAFAGALSLRWNEVEEAVAYRVYRGTSPYAEAAAALSDWLDAASFSDQTAEPGVRYHYWVKAALSRTGRQESAFSSAANGLMPLAAPTALETVFSAGRVLLEWDDVAGSTHYQVYRSESPDEREAEAIGPWQEGTAFVDGNTSPGVHYYYWVKAAKGSRGQLAGEFGTRATSLRAMPAPQRPRVSEGLFADRVELSWDEVQGASQYRVYRSTQANPTFHVPLGGWQRATQYTDLGVQPGVRYYYWVKAAPRADGQGASVFSAISSGFLGDTVLPAPAQVTATDGDFRDRVEIAWPEVTGGSHYRLYRSTQADTSTSLPLAGWQRDTAYEDREVVPGTINYYWVKVATDGAGENASDLGPVNSGYRALTPPSAVQATEDRLEEIEVSWGPTEGAGFFRVYRGTSPSPSKARALNAWQVEIRLTDRMATPGTTYHYWIKASPTDNGLNPSAFGEKASGYRALAAPMGLALEAEVSSLRFKWESVTGAAYYQVLRADAADVRRAEAVGLWQRETEFEDRMATPGVTYHYWVRAAVDAAGGRISAASAALNDYRRVSAPMIQSASQGEKGRVALVWEPVAGASHYQILRSETPFPGTAQALGGWQAETEFADARAELGTTYYYWVQAAVDQAGARVGAHSQERSGYRGLDEVALQILASEVERIDLSWDEVAGAAAYRVYRSERPDVRQAAPLASWQGGTGFNDDQALPGVTYYYWVRAAADNQGLNATAFGSAVSGYRALQDAGGLRVTRGVLDGVDLEWAEVTGATHYLIYRGLEEDVDLAAPLGSWEPATRFSDDTALPGVTYYYWVRSATSVLGHKAGTIGQAVQGYRGLATPGKILGSTGDPQSISIAWQAVESATHYQVYRTHDLENVLAAPISDWQEDVFFADPETQPGVTYHYWVRAAINPTGQNASRFSEATTAYRGLFAPQGVQIGSGRLGDVWLEWSPVVGASHYRIYRGLGEDLPGAELLTSWQEAREYADESAEPGVVYYYWVQAAAGGDGVNASVQSAGVSGFRGLTAPLSPLATTGEIDRVQLDWSPVPGGHYYRVMRSTVDDSLGATAGDWQADLTWTDREVAFGQTYYYWVQAAADADGAIASDLSPRVLGYEQLPAPTNLVIRPEGNAIVLSWDPNTQFDLFGYRVYAGVDSASASLVGSVAAADLSQLRVASVLLLPARFNLGDMGLSVLDNRGAINARFSALIGRDATEAELDELFTGRKLERDTVAPLNANSTYYFEVSAINARGSESERVSGRVLSVTTVQLGVEGGDEQIDIRWSSVWGAGAYRLYRHTNPDPQAAAPLGDWQEGIAFTDTSAPRGQDYYYWLRTAASLTQNNPSPFSEMATGFRPIAAPPLVAASRDLADRVRLEWHAGEGADAFQVYHHIDNDPVVAVPVSEWLSEGSFEHLAARPGENYYWIRAASGMGGEHASPLSAASTGQRTGPLDVPTDLQASWGAFKDRVVVTWKREPAATHVRLYRHTSTDASQAVAITDWVPWNGFEDLQAASDQIYYYWVRGATSTAGDHVTALSALGSGFRSGELFAPKGLETTTTPGKIFLSWEPNPESEVSRYRVYGGTLPGQLSLIDSIQADTDPRIIIRDVVPLPERFNVVDMGLDLLADRNQISARFAELFSTQPTSEWVGALFGGQHLDKDEITRLEAGQTYYFKVAAVDQTARTSMLSQPSEITVLSEVAGKVVATQGDLPAETGLAPNAPNPFNASTLIRFQLSASGPVRVRLYNALGQEILDLVDGEFAAGHYAVSWDGRDRRGVEVASGMFFYVLETEGGVWPRRMLLLR